MVLPPWNRSKSFSCALLPPSCTEWFMTKSRHESASNTSRSSILPFFQPSRRSSWGLDAAFSRHGGWARVPRGLAGALQPRWAPPQGRPRRPSRRKEASFPDPVWPTTISRCRTVRCSVRRGCCDSVGPTDARSCTSSIRFFPSPRPAHARCRGTCSRRSRSSRRQPQELETLLDHVLLFLTAANSETQARLGAGSGLESADGPRSGTRWRYG